MRFLRGLFRRRATRIAALVERGRRRDFRSSAYVRLWAPLTSEAASRKIEITLLERKDFEQAAEADLCIVQRTAIGREDNAERLVSVLRRRGGRLVIDNDDAFALVDETHPEFARLRAANAALVSLMSAAEQVWLSTEPLLEVYGGYCKRSHVIRNGLDARIWNASPSPSRDRGPDRARLLYMGTGTHDADFALVLPALDRLAEELPFTLTVIGAVRHPPERPWLVSMNPPADTTAYPDFVPWLRSQGPFDVGISPLRDTPFNRCKSDIKFLDYAALGIPAVVSDMRAYRDDPRIGELAVFAENSTQGWLAALTRVLEARASFGRTAAAARDYLWEHRTADHMARKQLALLDIPR